MAAPKPVAPEKPAPQRPRFRIDLSWWQGLFMWLGGAVFFCALSVGPGVYTQNWLIREDGRRLAEMDVPDNAVATALLAIDAQARKAETAYLKEHPESKVPTSDVTVLIGAAPSDPDLWQSLIGRPGSFQMAGAYLEATPAPLIVLPGLVSGLVAYLGGSLMAFVWWLMRGRRLA